MFKANAVLTANLLVDCKFFCYVVLFTVADVESDDVIRKPIPFSD